VPTKLRFEESQFPSGASGSSFLLPFPFKTFHLRLGMSMNSPFCRGRLAPEIGITAQGDGFESKGIILA
jgi:hypothetical protein